MADDRIEFTTPAGGRLVWGSLTEKNEKDRNGVLKVYKKGPKAGQPRPTWDFGVAIPKVPGQHWASTSWGAEIWKLGHSIFPDAQARADRKAFAWKVTDGDSQTPNKDGNKPCDQDGYPGHWVLAFSSEFAPSIYNGASGTLTPITQSDFVNLGDYVQVRANIEKNLHSDNPGVFINGNMVCFNGYGPRIVRTKRDPSQAGFATGVVAGASAAPVGGAMPGSTPPPAAGQASPPPAPPATTGAYTPPPAPGTTAAPGVAVTPNPAYGGAAPGSAPPPPPAGAAAAPPPPAAGKRMTAKATTTYEQYISSGWTDDVLVQHGLMER